MREAAWLIWKFSELAICIVAIALCVLALKGDPFYQMLASYIVTPWALYCFISMLYLVLKGQKAEVGGRRKGRKKG